jgi:hypothetical protein
MRTPGQWLRRMKRRKPGIYVYVTWQHLRPTRREFGYGGKARDLGVRGKCHLGLCHHPACRAAGAKPWMDLVIRRYTLRLPWWLGFDWITLSLETLMIWVLRPRYNDQKNPRRNRVRKFEQLSQRRERDARPPAYVAKIRVRRFLDLAMISVSMLLIVTGAVGFLVTR